MSKVKAGELRMKKMRQRLSLKMWPAEKATSPREEGLSLPVRAEKLVLKRAAARAAAPFPTAQIKAKIQTQKQKQEQGRRRILSLAWIGLAPLFLATCQGKPESSLDDKFVLSVIFGLPSAPPPSFLDEHATDLLFFPFTSLRPDSETTIPSRLPVDGQTLDVGVLDISTSSSASEEDLEAISQLFIRISSESTPRFSSSSSLVSRKIARGQKHSLPSSREAEARIATSKEPTLETSLEAAAGATTAAAAEAGATTAASARNSKEWLGSKVSLAPWNEFFSLSSKAFTKLEGHFFVFFTLPTGLAHTKGAKILLELTSLDPESDNSKKALDLSRANFAHSPQVGNAASTEASQKAFGRERKQAVDSTDNASVISDKSYRVVLGDPFVQLKTSVSFSHVMGTDPEQIPNFQKLLNVMFLPILPSTESGTQADSLADDALVLKFEANPAQNPSLDDFFSQELKETKVRVASIHPAYLAGTGPEAESKSAAAARAEYISTSFLSPARLSSADREAKRLAKDATTSSFRVYPLPEGYISEVGAHIFIEIDYQGTGVDKIDRLYSNTMGDIQMVSPRTRPSEVAGFLPKTAFESDLTRRESFAEEFWTQWSQRSEAQSLFLFPEEK